MQAAQPAVEMYARERGSSHIQHLTLAFLLCVSRRSALLSGWPQGGTCTSLEPGDSSFEECDESCSGLSPSQVCGTCRRRSQLLMSPLLVCSPYPSALQMQAVPCMRGGRRGEGGGRSVPVEMEEGYADQAVPTLLPKGLSSYAVCRKLGVVLARVSEFERICFAVS